MKNFVCLNILYLRASFCSSLSLLWASTCTAPPIDQPPPDEANGRPSYSKSLLRAANYRRNSVTI